MRVTMRDVARRAGVSLATVSYVANHGPKPVSDELRERILAAMQELGYRPARRGRARSRPLTVGAVVPDATNTFFSRALAGVESVLQPLGHVLLAGSSGEDPDRERELVTTLVRARVDGLILTPCRQVPPEIQPLDEGSLPVVLMDRDGGCTTLNRVVMDNYRSAFQAVRLLLESGHRRIALVNGPASVTTARERLRGYREALAFANVAVVDEYVRSGPFTAAHGRQATLDLLALRRRPEAIFSSSVLLTSGVVSALQARRLRWPQDIGLVGFGDDAWAALVTPPLTMIEQPARELGEVAARLLLATGTRAGERQHVVLDSHLVLRESHWRAPTPAQAGAAEAI